MSVLPKMEQPKRIAIYGGTFDPVHSGHLEIARRVSQFFAIDEFLFVPARVAPHKLDREVLPALHRYAMLALATRVELAALCFNVLNWMRPGRQYTVDTLYHFRLRFGESAESFLSWARIRGLRSQPGGNGERLMTLANLIVVTRPGYEIAAAPATAETAASIVDVRGAAEVSRSKRTGIAKSVCN